MCQQAALAFLATKPPRQDVESSREVFEERAHVLPRLAMSYKGPHIPYEAFPAQLRTRCDWQKRQSRASHKSKRHTTPRQTPLHRFNILQVNVGGLSKMRLQEIQHWALQKEADIVILTETRWSFSTDWSTDSWHCIHSGTQQDKSDGILIMIRPQACSPTQLGIAEFSPAGSC